MDITTPIGIIKDAERNLSVLNDINRVLVTTRGRETPLPPYNDKTFINIYTTLRCIQGFITIVVNVITIIAITRYKKVSVYLSFTETDKIISW